MMSKNTTHTSNYPKGGLTNFLETFAGKQTLYLRINFCSKTPALLVAANRCNQF